MWESAGATTVLSGVMGEKAIELGAPPSLVHVIHLGKRLGDYPFEARTGPVRKFVSIGRLVEKKGHTDLLQAFQRVEDTWKDANLTIIGDGPLAGDLRELVERLGLTHRVHLLGACGHADAVRHLQSADAFILCSRTGSDGDQEGTPTVLLEAQAIGLPCISTWHAGIPEVIPPENHWLLAQEGDPLSIAEKLTALLSVDGSAVRECSEYGRHHVVEHFDVVQETAKMCGLYAEVRSSFQMLKQAGMESMEGLADRPVPAVGR
jgi:glycosyltransferase involved in cell wall biosynthesis